MGGRQPNPGGPLYAEEPGGPGEPASGSIAGVSQQDLPPSADRAPGSSAADRQPSAEVRRPPRRSMPRPRALKGGAGRPGDSASAGRRAGLPPRRTTSWRRRSRRAADPAEPPLHPGRWPARPEVGGRGQRPLRDFGVRGPAPEQVLVTNGGQAGGPTQGVFADRAEPGPTRCCCPGAVLDRRYPEGDPGPGPGRFRVEVLRRRGTRGLTGSAWSSSKPARTPRQQGFCCSARPSEHRPRPAVLPAGRQVAGDRAVGGRTRASWVHHGRDSTSTLTYDGGAVSRRCRYRLPGAGPRPGIVLNGVRQGPYADDRPGRVGWMIGPGANVHQGGDPTCSPTSRPNVANVSQRAANRAVVDPVNPSPRSR